MGLTLAPLKRTAAEEIDGEEMLRHAIEYLEPFGIGHNYEYQRARQILQLARQRVITETD